MRRRSLGILSAIWFAWVAAVACERTGTCAPADPRCCCTPQGEGASLADAMPCCRDAGHAAARSGAHVAIGPLVASPVVVALAGPGPAAAAQVSSAPRRSEIRLYRMKCALLL